MVHGYHLILTAYGFWLPNDPRGSWSDFVGSWELLRFGRTTRSLPKKTLQQLTEVELKKRDAARRALKYPPVQFSVPQMQAIADGFAKACRQNGYTIWACSILPEHTHLVVSRHRYKVEYIANLLKGATTRMLVESGCHPLAKYARRGKRPPGMWTEGQWKTFLDSESDIENAMAYVLDNPKKEGKPAQQWPFVTPFAGISRGGWLVYHESD